MYYIIPLISKLISAKETIGQWQVECVSDTVKTAQLFVEVGFAVHNSDYTPPNRNHSFGFIPRNKKQIRVTKCNSKHAAKPNVQTPLDTSCRSSQPNSILHGYQATTGKINHPPT